MIERIHAKLCIDRQCKILGISRSSVYYSPENSFEDRDLSVLKVIREVLDELPFYRYRKVARKIQAKEIPVTEKQVRRIMTKAGPSAIFPGRNLSKARHEHKKYPYLLSGKIIRHPYQVWATDLT